MLRRLFLFLAGGIAAAILPSQVDAAHFASKVVSYNAGAADGTGYNDPTTALGAPAPLVGEGIGFPNVLSPFSPAFEAEKLLQIGEGGQLTLQLSNYALTGVGLAIGVVTNVGLFDTSYPLGQTGAVAGTLSPPASAVVDVSEDGNTWVSLGSVLFDVPANYYLDAGPFDTAAGSVLADFGLPFAGSLASFNNSSYSQILATLAGSGGGRWLDLSGTGLSQIGYIRFAVPDDRNPATDQLLTLDAVSIANAALGAPVPEPGTWALLALGAACCWGARRRRALGVLVALGMLGGQASAAPLLNETFGNDPVAAGRAQVQGDSSRVSYSAAGLTLHYDSALPTTQVLWPLSKSLGAADDFRLSVDFTIHSKNFFASQQDYAQIAFGLSNSLTTGTDRNANTDDFVGIDYYPSTVPTSSTFNLPTLGPTVITSNDGSDFFGRIRFPFGSESGMKKEGPLPLDTLLHATLTHDVATQQMILSISSNSGPLPINTFGSKLGNVTGGADGDVSTIQLFLPFDANFSVDQLTLAAWYLPSFLGSASVLQADITFSHLRVDTLPVPEPGSIVLCAVGTSIMMGLVIHRQRARQSGTTP